MSHPIVLLTNYFEQLLLATIFYSSATLLRYKIAGNKHSYMLLVCCVVLLPVFHRRPDLGLETPCRLTLVRNRPVGSGNGVGVQLGGIGETAPGIANQPVDDKQSDVNALGAQIARQRLAQQSLGTLLGGKSHCDGLAPEGGGRSRHQNGARGRCRRCVFSPLDHARCDVLRRTEEAVDVSLHGRVEILEFDLVPGLMLDMLCLCFMYLTMNKWK